MSNTTSIQEATTPGSPSPETSALRDKAASWGLDFRAAAKRLSKVVYRTPLAFNQALSRKYNCRIFLKREDLQVVRSYKLRGAYNMMVSLPAEQLQKGVVCASAGNHAQGFAYSCHKLNVKGVVFMPIITPRQKINQIGRAHV